MANIYFGNIRKAQYIPAPKAGMDGGRTGYEESLDYRNGGTFITQSTGGSRKFAFGWDVTPKASLDCLQQYRNGDYGTGLLYWVDPFADNAMPPHWANPSLSTRGWPSLVGAGTAAEAVDSMYTRTNLYVDPSPTTLTGFSTQTGGGTWTQSIQPTGGSDGTTWYRMINTATNTTSPVGFNMTAAGTGAVPVTAGETYTYSLWFIASMVPASVIRVQLQFYNAAGTLLGAEITGSSTTYAVAATWQRMSASYVTPVGAAYVRPMIRTSTTAGAWAVGSYMGASNIMVEQGPNLNPWINGSADAPASLYNMPYQSARYTLSGAVGAVPKRKLTMLIPPDKNLTVGFSGSATNAAVYCVAVGIDGVETLVGAMPLLSAGQATRYSATIPGYLYKAVYFYLTPTAVGGGSITLTSASAAYTSFADAAPTTGVHISGDGHTGCRMSDVGMVYVQAAKGRKLVTAATTLTEIGAWL